MNERSTTGHEAPGDNSMTSEKERPARPKSNRQSAPDLSNYDFTNDWRSGNNAWNNASWQDALNWGQRRNSDPGHSPVYEQTFPRIDAKSRRVNPTMNISISDPPQLGPTKFEVFRRELLWRGDIHYAIDDSALISVLAIRSKDEFLKGLLTSFTQGARNNIEGGF